MIITIDHGNTSCSVALFKEGKLVDILEFEEFEKDQSLKNLNGSFSSVGKERTFPSQLIRPLQYFEEKKFLEMPVHYSMTLGEDRLVCAYHVFKKDHGENSSLKRTLVVDAGTFLTVDCVSKSGFEGGFIFPGLQVYLDSYKSGAALSGLSEAVIDEREVKLPSNTNEAIAESAKIYLLSLFKELTGRFSPSKIVLTGGNSKKVATFLSDCQVPVEHHENLVHQALYTFWSELNSTT